MPQKKIRTYAIAQTHEKFSQKKTMRQDYSRNDMKKSEPFVVIRSQK